MHFKNGFKDENAERYMLLTRIQKLVATVRSEYYYDGYADPGTLEALDGLYSYEEAMEESCAAKWRVFDGHREKWGGPNQNVWFRHRFAVPPDMAGKELHYCCDLSCNSGWYWGAPQCLAYVNGSPLSGMDTNHRYLILTDSAVSGETYDVAICAFTDRFFYQGQIEMNMAVRSVNPLGYQLYWDLFVPMEVADQLDVNDTRRMDIIEHLNNALSLVDFRLPNGEADVSLQAAIDYMKEEFYGRFCGDSEATVTCVGHTHIDTAWLWTLEQTRKKVCRSFTTAISIANRYPEFTFMSSQPQLYQFFKELMPEKYDEIKKLAAQGRWEPEGGMWVEADTNIPNGESLVRQILYGKRFFRDEFGVDNRILWLPDVFGYSGALPQILKKSGIDYFMTTKISWNEYDKFPYDTFKWRGIDGSEVLSHFICTKHNDTCEADYLTSYNGYLGAPYVMGSWKRYQQKDLNRDILLSYGHGDGGGGPEHDMVEQAKRMTYGIPGCPKVVLSSPLRYFEKLDKEVSGNPKLPVWWGELYFEYHRGTYTSVAKIKKNMRKSEILLQDAELFSVLSNSTVKKEYPRQPLNQAWHTLLLNQFHDILPGSSIKEVYDDSDVQFEEIKSAGNAVLNSAIEAVADQLSLDENSVVLFNGTSFNRSDVTEFQPKSDNFTLYDGSEVIPWQKTNKNTALFYAKNIPAKGYKSFTLRQNAAAPIIEEKMIQGNRLENAYFAIELDEHANMVSWFDKRQKRELVAAGQPVNRLIALEDMPPADDAWNINAYINEKKWQLDDADSIRIVENGPVRGVVEVQRTFRHSVITQQIVIYHDIDRLDIHNTIDWQDKNILLKADFPVTINATRAAFDIQFGNVDRSTTENTSWDFAQFEVCAHRWADISDEGHGLSVLNDCKYGYDVKKGHIRLTLLKSSVYPDPSCDKHIHEFTYSIYPHKGGWRQAQTVEYAANVNCPLYVAERPAQQGTLPSSYSFVSCSARNVMIDTVKFAEEDDHVIVRLYEYHNCLTSATLTFAKPIREAYLCNLMEEQDTAVPFTDNRMTLDVKPYEIVTLKLRYK